MLRLHFNLADLAVVSARLVGGDPVRVMLTAAHLPYDSSPSFKARAARLAHAASRGPTSPKYWVRSRESPWVPWTPDFSGPWRVRLELPLAAPWTCELRGWPPTHRAMVTLYFGTASEPGGELNSASIVARFRLGANESRLLQLAPGEYTATLQGAGARSLGHGVLGRQTFALATGRPVTTTLVAEGPVRTEQVSVRVVAGERGTWKTKLWIRGPGPSSHRSLLSETPWRGDVDLSAEVVPQDGYYLVYDLGINFAAFFSLRELRERGVAIPEEGRALIRVVDADTNVPVPAAHVTIPLHSSSGIYARPEADSDGVFRLPEGSYFCSASADGYVRSESREIEVRSGESTSVVVALDRPRRVVVDLVGAELRPGDRLVLTRAEDDAWEDCDSLELGEKRGDGYEFSGLAPGRYGVFVEDEGYRRIRGPVRFELERGQRGDKALIVRLPQR